MAGPCPSLRIHALRITNCRSTNISSISTGPPSVVVRFRGLALRIGGRRSIRSVGWLGLPSIEGTDEDLTERHVSPDNKPACLVCNQDRRDSSAWAAIRLLVLKAARCSARPRISRQRRSSSRREPSSPSFDPKCFSKKSAGASYTTDAAAGAYYAERVTTILSMWDRFPSQNRIGLTHRMLIADPVGQLERISSFLGLQPALENQYVSPRASTFGGGGDPLTSHRFSQIVGRPEASTIGAKRELEISPQELDRLHSLYRTFESNIGTGS